VRPANLLGGIAGWRYIPIMSELEKIAKREKEVQASITALQKEAEELAIARRVLASFAATTVARPIQRYRATLNDDSAKLGPKRPVGAPSTFAMAEDILGAAEGAGKDGLTGKELVDAMREKYWPGLQSAQVLPIIYGFVRGGRMRKTPGGKFKRLKKAEG
jgi:hypothetical protein